MDMTRFDDVIGEIFETLIKNHKALEINTSGIAMPLGDTLPGEAYIQRFHDMGGQYITVGSDAHVPEKLCGNVDKGMALAKKCGFDYVTISSTAGSLCWCPLRKYKERKRYDG